MRPQRRYFGVQLSFHGVRRLSVSKEDIFASIREQLVKAFGEMELVKSQLRVLHLTPVARTSPSITSTTGTSSLFADGNKAVLVFCVCARQSFERVSFAVALLRGITVLAGGGSSSSKSKELDPADDDDFPGGGELGDATISLLEEDERQTKALSTAAFFPAMPQVRFVCGALEKAQTNYRKVYEAELGVADVVGIEAKKKVVEDVASWNDAMKREVEQLVARVA
ncbi:unnamed protein product [Amoebophrya sp. A120]|nr:unnamed protein product [Amoebophrya sp. A120]|eukprot:GSA120T00002280001.1